MTHISRKIENQPDARCSRVKIINYGHRQWKDIGRQQERTVASVSDYKSSKLSKGRTCNEADRKTKANWGSTLTQILLTKMVFRRSLYYGIFIPPDRSTRNNSHLPRHIYEMARKVDQQVKYHHWEASDQTSIPSFSSAFQMTCNANRIDEGVIMWFLHYFVKLQQIWHYQICLRRQKIYRLGIAAI